MLYVLVFFMWVLNSKWTVTLHYPSKIRSRYPVHKQTILSTKSSLFSGTIFLSPSFWSELTEVGSTIGERRIGSSTRWSSGSTREGHGTEGGRSLKVAHTKLGRSSLGCSLDSHLLRERDREQQLILTLLHISFLWESTLCQSLDSSEPSSSLIS